MEDSSLTSRRTRPPQRPESSLSSNTKMPSQSISSASTSSSQQRPITGASLLQERIRERKCETAKKSTRRSFDMGGERALQISPITYNADRRPSSSGKPLGVKGMEEHVSKLTKENFSLKLELHHRRERQTGLEERLEAAERQLEEQKELQEISDQLVAELEKRDQAVEEAVGIIVDLEDRIDQLMREREVVKDFDAQYKPSYYQSGHDDPSSSSPTLDNKNKLSSQTMARVPSFLSEQSEGAEALRSLYLPHGQSYSEAALPKLPEDASVNGIERMDSPGLSDLSESSFVSIYGDQRLSLDVEDQDDSPLRRHRKADSVEKWIDNRPTSTNPALPRNDLRKNQYLSLNSLIESPLQRLEKLKNTLERNNPSVISSRQELVRSTVAKERRKHRDSLRPVFTEKTSFDHQQGLPPTPDTISTSTLRHYQNSNDTLAQDAKGKTFLSSTSTFAAPLRSHAANQSTNFVRPRSAGETINSRREGHGWDTETQDDFSSTASTFSAAPQPQQRAVTPDLFNFSSFSASADSYTDVGQNMMFDNNDEPSLPSHTVSRYEQLRRSKGVDNPQSDDTIRDASRYDDHQYGTAPLDTSPRPFPPARRSSLSYSTNLRKSQNSSSISSGQQSNGNSPVSTKTEPPKKKGLTNRLFNRSEANPTLNTFQAQSPRQKETPRAQTQLGSYALDDERGAATPPPIRRSRDASAPVAHYRPSSAGAGSYRNTLRRASAFGGDGGEIVDTGALMKSEPVADEAPGKKKWFGLGRSGSLRR